MPQRQTEAGSVHVVALKMQNLQTSAQVVVDLYNYGDIREISGSWNDMKPAALNMAKRSMDNRVYRAKDLYDKILDDYPELGSKINNNTELWTT